MDEPKDKLDESDEQSKAYLRQIVIEAAMGGIKSKRRPRLRNPLYEPDPRFDAAAGIAGSCRRILEKMAEGGPSYVFAGFVDDGMRSRSLKTFRACRDALNQLLEYADAEGQAQRD